MTNLIWTLEFTEKARKQFLKLDKVIQKRILSSFKRHILVSHHPEECAKRLSGDLSHCWRFRIQDYRVICTFDQMHLIITAIKVGHRRDIYH